MAKAVKLADMAEQLGVSTVTISKALSGQKGVSDELRERIVALADELGYVRPSVIKKEIEPKKSFNIAVLIHEKYFDKYDSFYLKIYQHITQIAIANGCFTFLEIVTEEAETNCDIPLVIQEQKADGIIMVGRHKKSYTDNLNVNTGAVPFIHLDYCDTLQNSDAIISDSFYGAYSLTNYLFEMGHRQIGYVGNLLFTGPITDRYLGYVKSLMEHGCQVRNDWVLNDRYEESGKIFDVEDFQLPKTMPTAFVCNCDVTASRLIKKMNDKGYSVPEDVSVVGYDNYLYPGLSDIEITTYEVDIREMAKKAVSIILKKIRKEKYKAGINIIEGRLVIKDSVKRLV